MFIVLVLSYLASSYGQRPATDSSVVILSSFSNSKFLSSLPESSAVLQSSDNFKSTIFREQIDPTSVDEDDGVSSSFNQYFSTPLWNQYSVISPGAIQSFSEEYNSLSFYRLKRSSDFQDDVHNILMSSSFQTSFVLEPSVSSIYGENSDQFEETEVFSVTSISSPAISSIKPSLELSSATPVTGNHSQNRGHSVDDILGSIIHLLGSNGKAIRPEAERVSHEKAAAPTRKNDRGPPKTYTSATIPISSTSVIHPSPADKNSSVQTINENSPLIFNESLSTIVATAVITPSFSLVENEVSEGSSIKKVSSLFNFTTTSLYNVTKNIQNNELVISTKDILNSSTLSSSNYTSPMQETSVHESQISSENTIEIISAATQTPHIPTGPITDWVPLIERPSLKNKHLSDNNVSELVILTEPSIFNLTVTNTLSQLTAPTDPRIFPSEQSTISNASSSNAQSTRSNSGSTHILEDPSNQPESLETDYEGPAEEAAEIEEVIVTLLGSGTMKSPTSTTAPAIPGSATGRPYVIPVDIEEVRPFIGAQIPTRPNSHGRPQASGDHVQVAAAGINVADENGAKKPPSLPNGRPSLVRPIRPRPTPPLVRIDTCIVGDDSTCDIKLNEYCKTDQGISSCQCRPGYSRTFPRGPCQAVIKILVSIRLDRLGDQKLIFSHNYLDPGSQEYQQLEYETRQAINSLFSYTPFARTFMGSNVNKFYSLGRKVIANSTILLDESTQSPNLRQKIRKEIVKAIASRNHNLGESKLYVDESLNPIPAIEDLNECSDPNLNDCSSSGYCVNAFATFRCVCNPGFMDKYADEERKSGRTCTACAPDYCNNHGVCIIANGQRECKCRGNYIGSRCEIDGEVLGVALGASLAAMVIIVLTLVCLCVWNRRWKREQYKADMTSVPSMGGYANKTITPINTYRLTIEDRVRWAHIADAMGSNYATVDRLGRSLPNKQEREDNYYGHPGRPRSRLCLNGTQPNGYYNQEYPPRESYHPLPNRFLTAGNVRPYYS